MTGELPDWVRPDATTFGVGSDASVVCPAFRSIKGAYIQLSPTYYNWSLCQW